MWSNNIKLDFFEDTLYSQKHLIRNIVSQDNPLEVFNSKVEIIRLVNDFFPNCSPEDKYKILYLVARAHFRDSDEKTQLVWSGPEVVGIPGRDTEILLEELVSMANYNIILSVYSISEYASNLLKLIRNKVNQGIYVEIYVNEFENKKEYFEDLISVKSNRLFIYNYSGATNNTQALHAKVMTVDDKKALITSSNLSYNGMDGNLELGVLINSKEKVKEIRAIFSTLLDKKYFEKISD